MMQGALPVRAPTRPSHTRATRARVACGEVEQKSWPARQKRHRVAAARPLNRLLRLLLLSRVASRCGSRRRGEIARALVNRTRNAETRIGAEPLDEFGGLGIGLELERLLGPFRNAIWGLALVVPCVDVRATVHVNLNHLVQTSERRSVQRRVVGLVDGVDVGAGR